MRKVDPVKYDEKRRQILDAARGCFNRDGFRGASISDICAAAGMSPGHLYHYFDSKEAIVKAIVERGLEEAASVFGQLADRERIVEAVVAEMDHRLKQNRRGEGSFALEILAESARNPAIAGIVQRRERARRELLSRLLREGQKRQQVDSRIDPEAAAALVLSIFESMRLLTIRDPGFDTKRGVEMLKLLITRFLAPRTTTFVKERLGRRKTQKKIIAGARGV